MKQFISILKDNTILYEGRISDLPIKETYIMEKSIELFDDDDPCIIHQSYVIKEFVDQLLSVFRHTKNTEINVKNHLEELSFLNFEELEKLIIKLKE